MPKCPAMSKRQTTQNRIRSKSSSITVAETQMMQWTFPVCQGHAVSGIPGLMVIRCLFYLAKWVRAGRTGLS